MKDDDLLLLVGIVFLVAVLVILATYGVASSVLLPTFEGSGW